MSGSLELDRPRFPALLLVLAGLVLWHVIRLPEWPMFTALALFAWRGWMVKSGRWAPPRWLLISIGVVLLGGVFASARGVPGRDGCVALLCGLSAIKAMEARGRRDVLLLIFLGYFLVATHLLYETGFVPAVVLFAVVLLLMVLQLAWHQQDSRGNWQMQLGPLLKTILTMALQGAPLLVLLYLVFPRLDGPLWKLPADRHQSRSGLGDQMSPGSFSSMVQDTSVAFRSDFQGKVPDESMLYWRGPVLEFYDGTTWFREAHEHESPALPEAIGQTQHYTMRLEPGSSGWVPALDAPSSVPAGTTLTPLWQLRQSVPVNTAIRYELDAALNYRATRIVPQVRANNLRLPQGLNPRTNALAMRLKNLPDTSRVDEGLRLLALQGLRYTLEPPLYPSSAVDAFLFDGKAGFCEHFAGAYVWLMRAAGVPARVVGGYQGGQVEGHAVVVRQSDAHAWAEVWLEGEGWRRVDPTFTVAPARIQRGLQAAVPQSELPFMLRDQAAWLRSIGNGIATLNRSWSEWIVGFDQARQRAVLEKLGLGSGVDDVLRNLVIGGFTVMGIVAGWIMWPRSGKSLDSADKIWVKVRRRMRRAGMTVSEATAPLSVLAMLNEINPAAQAAHAALIHAWLAARYAPVSSQHVKVLKQAYRAWRRVSLRPSRPR
ncbi:DUF3488 and transglutaminase-like domain-containing protein [Burkholderiaceae bacterium DAT-1]|nr:DUF3488 and transglutaminase-like domain-containing protein [Burkholderiaceae bacterium DAT-1]